MQSATQSAVNQKDWIQQINIYTNMYQTLFKRNEVVKRSAGFFFSKVEETNQKASRGIISYKPREYYIRNQEEYLMQKLNLGYSDLHKFLVDNFIDLLNRPEYRI